MTRITRSLLFLLASAVGTSALAAQDGSEIIRGRIATPAGEPISDARITITGTMTRSVRTVSSDSKGQFTMVFSPGEGEYVVNARRIGSAQVWARVARTGLSTVLTVDLVMTDQPYLLDSLTVTARRDSAEIERSIGGAETDLTVGALFSLDPGDLLALAAQVPGVLGDSSGFSVLGIGSDQNGMLVDGNSSRSTSLPQDAIAGASLAITSFDPSRGRFSGAQTSVRTRGGTDLTTGTLRSSFNNHHLTWADPRSPNPSPELLSASGSLGGPIRKGRAHYFGAFEVRNNTTESYSLHSPRAVLLEQNGLSIDSVSYLSELLRDLSIPLRAPGGSLSRSQNRQNIFARVDLTPGGTTSLRFRVDGTWNQSGGAGTSPLAYPSSANTSTSSNYGLQASGTTMFGKMLAEVRTQLSSNQSESGPEMPLPSGSVRVGVAFDDDRTGLTTLRFGGGNGGERESGSVNWETVAELSLVSNSGAHRLKGGGSFELSDNWSRNTPNQFGSYSFQSMADLAAGTPSSYSRTLTAQRRDAGGATSAVWLSDEWRASQSWQFQFGGRADFVRPGSLPEYNAEVNELFGIHTDRVPSSVGFSPRLGFSWTSIRARRSSLEETQEMLMAGAMGGEAVAMMRENVASGGFSPTGSARNRSITVSGGIGAFRNVISIDRIASLRDQTGLPTTTRLLSCVGAATPVPTWDLSVPGPDECVDGGAPGEFSSRSPGVTVYDRSFRPPVSWRGNLGLFGLRPLGAPLTLNLVHSLNRGGESSIDLNMQRTVGFTLPGEGNRPVYVQPGSIVAATGAIAPGAARIHSQYGAVRSTLSDLNNRTTQVTASLSIPRPLFGRVTLNTSYTWSYQVAESRGFGGNTGGDPFLKESSRAGRPTHQISLTSSARVWWFRLQTRINALSGYRYTPMVAGDINGDGMSNDRAFIADPAMTADPLLASQMASLLASAPASARDCLERQFGSVAGRNSCRSGWQIRTDFGLSFQPPQNFGYGDRIRITANMVNASGALLRLTGLADTPLGRSMTSAQPDARLLYVEGFNPETRQFSYRVNQLFGEPQDYGNRARRISPFQLQLGAQIAIGGPPRNPMARGLGLAPDKGAAPLNREEIETRLARMTRDPLQTILAARDSLVLSTAQIDSLEKIHARRRITRDSLLEPLVVWVESRRGKVDDQGLSQRLGQIQPAIQREMREATVEAGMILTVDQRRRLPTLFPADRPAPAGGPARARGQR